MKNHHWHLTTDDEGISWLHADTAGASVNVLNEDSFNELDKCLDTIAKDKPTGLIITSGKATGFIAGADVKYFSGLRDQEKARHFIQRTHKLFAKLEKLRCPTLALIHGHCLGGGLELSLACDYLLVSDHPATRLGLPEVKLGIHPGFGGTVRLIKRIGVLAAMPLMLSGRLVSAYTAVKMGIADELVAERHLHTAARRYLRTRPPHHRPPWWDALLRPTPCRYALSRYFDHALAKKVRREHYPAPYALIDLWRRHGNNEKSMLQAEARSDAELVVGDTAQNLVRLFLLRERLKKFARSKADDKVTQHIHIVGAGVMGGDIAAWCALRGMRVSLQDTRTQALASAVGRAHSLFRKKLKLPRDIRAAMDRLIPDSNGAGITHANIIIEAIVEDLKAKQTLFRQLEDNAKESCLLATNTSSLPLEDIGQVLTQPGRLVGLHFFNPVAQMPLIEIVHAAGTHSEVVDRACRFAVLLDKLPLPVKSAPGFLVNRILMPYLLEAVTLLDEGVAASVIDRAATDFGMPIGPIQLADQVGLDICLSVAGELSRELGFAVPALLQSEVERGHHGKKSGQGFYRYHKGRAIHEPVPKDSPRPDDLTDRLMCSLLNEAVHCLRDGIVTDAELLDAGVVFGTGFAPHRGGPMHYMGSMQEQILLETWRKLEKQHGERFHIDDDWAQWLTPT